MHLVGFLFIVVIADARNHEPETPIMIGEVRPRAGLSVVEKKTPLAGSVNRTLDHHCSNYATPGSNSLKKKKKSNVSPRGV
jgi:hypothetical protein